MSSVLAKRELIPHPDFKHPDISLGAKLTKIGSDVLKIEYAVAGDIGALLLPPPSIPEFTDELWQHTCFEAFLGSGELPGYIECNFAPSRKWALYRLEGYRDGLQPALDLAGPDLFVEEQSASRFALTVILDASGMSLAQRSKMGLSAVIEAKDGNKSYWALAHPPGDPDFHHPDCFALTLPAPGAA